MPQSFAIAATVRAGCGDVADRVGTGIAELGRVIGATDPEGIKHDQHGALHLWTTSDAEHRQPALV